MVLNEIKKQLSEIYPGMDINLGYLYKIRAVRFERDSKGNISGRITEGIVFRHREHEDEIRDGDIWICHLQENYNNSRQFFATPLKKIDEQFLYELTAEQMKGLADHVWAEHPDMVEGLFKERFSARFEEMVAEARKSIEAEAEIRSNALSEENRSLAERNDSLLTQMSSLNEDLSASRDENDRLLKQIDLFDSVVTELKETLALKESVLAACQKEITDLNSRLARTVRAPMEDGTATIVRVHPDTLYFDMLDDGRYTVRIDVNATKMVIVPDEKGRVSCTDGMMRLGGLEEILPFTDTERYVCRTEGGRMIISLPGRAVA